MKKILFTTSVFVLMHGWALMAAAYDRMVIDSITPAVAERGAEIIIRGRNFGSPAGKRLTIYRIVHRQAESHTLSYSQWTDSLIRAHIPGDLPPDQYGVQILIPGREFLSSNTIPVVLRPPAPPAQAADVDLVLENDCQAVSTRVDDRYERSTVRECPRPLKNIWVSDARLAHPRGQIVIGGAGPARSDLVIALVDIENIRTARGISERFYVRRLLQNYGGANGFLGAAIPENLAPGRYTLALLYRLPGPERTRPLLMKGSNAVGFAVTR